jgi:hypothetical protein
MNQSQTMPVWLSKRDLAEQSLTHALDWLDISLIGSGGIAITIVGSQLE